jgi:hypothetical protein
MSNIDTINDDVTARDFVASNQAQQGTKMFELLAAPFVFLYKHLFTISVIAVLLIGWLNRDSNYLSAENGTGYALGIVGGSLMLLVLLYPLSKRLSLLSRMVPVRYWFGIHMLFGIIGPVLILYHSNFHFGSANSSVALISMLLVAGSGLIGRYIYTHIHHGLYGKRITFNELKQELETENTELLYIYKLNSNLNKMMSAMESKALQQYTGILMSLLHSISLTFDAQRLQSKFKQLLNSSQNDSLSTTLPDSAVAKEFIRRYTDTLRKIVALRMYERLFSLWHILHLPLFIMMIITAVIHIFAVHMY